MSDKLSRDEIQAMEAGRDMDALVAERVMGWRLTDRGFYVKGKGQPESYDKPETFKPTRDIAAAWQVVEKLLSSHEISIANSQNNEGNYWGVDFYTMIDDARFDTCFTADAPTVELAICRAALLAAMEEG